MTSLESLLQKLQDRISCSRLPSLEPSVFTGEVLSYRAWRQCLNVVLNKAPFTNIEKLLYLRQFVDGEVKEIVDCFSLFPTDDTYEQVLTCLDERYGDPRIIAHAYRKKLDSWPVIKERDGQALRKFSDFLNECHRAQASNKISTDS